MISLYRKYIFLLLILSISTIASAADDKQRQEAISEFNEDLCNSWNGQIQWRLADGEVLQDTLRFEMKQDDQGSHGEFFLGNNGKQKNFAIHLNAVSETSPHESSGWINSENNLLNLWMPQDALGKLQDNHLVFLDTTGQNFEMRLENKGFDLYLNGQLPFLPDDASAEIVSTVAHLRRDSFRLTLGMFEITLMECLGVFATLFFASRFVVQWVASERAKKSVVPEMFWWISLIGAMMMMTYGIYFERAAVILGQLTGWVVYIRNIWLIEKEKSRARKLKKNDAQS